MGVGQCLQRGEGFGADDEQRLGGVEVAGGLDQCSGVHVGDKAAAQIALAVVAQGLVGHDRAEVRAADADIDDVANALAAVAPPFAAAQCAGQRLHAIQHGMHFGDDILSVHEHLHLLRGAQCCVQRGALLGGVDGVAPEHRVPALTQTAAFGHVHQQAQGFIVDALFGVVEVPASCLGVQALAALCIFCKKLAKMLLADSLVVLDQRLPDWPAGQRWQGNPRSGSGSGRVHGAVFCESAFALSATCSSRLFQEAEKDSVPSRCRRSASASGSMPALRHAAMVASALLASSVRLCRTFPWSAKANSVFSGMVLMVLGAASASR